MSHKTALIVEDTAANRIFFERLIQQAGFDIISVASGKEALQKASETPVISLALIDMEIPDVNGLELTYRLRTIYPDMCIVVATMHDERSLMQSAFEKGCDVFLVKPHGFMELFKRLTTEGTASIREKRPVMIDQYGPHVFKTVASK